MNRISTGLPARIGFRIFPHAVNSASNLCSSLTFGFVLFAAIGICKAEPSKDEIEFFENHVRPILVENCYKCHSVEQGKSKGGLTLDSRDG